MQLVENFEDNLLTKFDDVTERPGGSLQNFLNEFNSHRRLNDLYKSNVGLV